MSKRDKELYFTLCIYILAVVLISIAVCKCEPLVGNNSISDNSTGDWVQEEDETSVEEVVYEASDNRDKTVSYNGFSVVVPSEVDTQEARDAVEQVNNNEKIKNTIIEEIDSLKSGSDSTVKKWYGSSDVYTPDLISVASSRVIINFIDKDLDRSNVRLHCCVVNNDLVQKEIDKMSKKAKTEEDLTEVSNKIAERILNGEFNECYNVNIQLNSDGIIPTEELKTIMSGFAYKTVDVKLVECMVEHEKEELGYE